MSTMSTGLKSAATSIHKMNILDAVTTYTQMPHTTITYLAVYFNVSENLIADWFCEAISNGYINNDATCIDIMKKHIVEYERKHQLSNSSLRAKYKAAFESRYKNAVALNINELVGI